MRALFGVVLLLAVPVGVQAQTHFAVTNFGTSAYRFNGVAVNNPPQTLERGKTYVFDVNAVGHPFYIKTTLTTGTTNQYSTGVTGQGATSGPCTFVVPMSAPNTLYYHCSLHTNMGAALNIINPPVDVPQGGVPQTAWLGLAVPNPSKQGASFRFGLPRSARIDFAVFDSHGRRVRDVSSEVLPAGEHSLAWDGRDRSGRQAPSGLYYYRLKVEDRVLSGRLIVTH